jgi:type I restriction enzyme M protein
VPDRREGCEEIDVVLRIKKGEELFDGNGNRDMKEDQFLSELDKKLWNAADKLRSNLDAAVYKHAVLGPLCQYR